MNLKDYAKIFQPKKTRNISELPSVPTALEILQDTGVDMNGDEYEYNYVEINNERFRVPDSVIEQLKTIIEKKPNLQNFAVTKKGEGKQTRYTVISLD